MEGGIVRSFLINLLSRGGASFMMKILPETRPQFYLNTIYFYFYFYFCDADADAIEEEKQ